MRQFTSVRKNNELLEALRNAPSELRSIVPTLVTDSIYWHNAGPHKTCMLSNNITLISEFIQGEFHLEFKQGSISAYNAKIKKWPDNWLDEEAGRDKMKM